MKAAQRDEVGDPVEKALAQHPVRLAPVRREVWILVAVPGHVVEGVPRGRQRSVEIPNYVEGLNDVVMFEADGGALEVIDGRAAVGVDIVDDEVSLVLERPGRVVQSVDQLACLLWGQVLFTRPLPLVPPIRFWIGVPRVPNDLPSRIAGRRDLQDFQERELRGKPQKACDRFRVAAIRYRNDAATLRGIVQLR